ncbi:hypothetical protein CONLIGDRAFT_212493 [Coniochaeta ligniaria NRRL 30616]|uniref:Uncharacterized protein n=1 Tax=Coniochaeta ligniaria NRRL 30616 TaxID=1408157 RepID=A0A1J7J2Y9_9PEZI|nr:hypothetical protein CONLIGDRAFT_212493 [Coniochaeta ligniaria NRRL 30616]
MSIASPCVATTTSTRHLAKVRPDTEGTYTPETQTQTQHDVWGKRHTDATKDGRIAVAGSTTDRSASLPTVTTHPGPKRTQTTSSGGEIQKHRVAG